MDKIKATREELRQTEALVGDLNDRVKHLSNVVCSMTASLLPIKNSLGIYDDHTQK